MIYGIRHEQRGGVGRIVCEPGKVKVRRFVDEVNSDHKREKIREQAETSKDFEGAEDCCTWRKGTELEKRRNYHLMALLSQYLGRLTSRMTAQGAETASKVVFVTAHVIGFAS